MGLAVAGGPEVRHQQDDPGQHRHGVRAQPGVVQGAGQPLHHRARHHVHPAPHPEL